MGIQGSGVAQSAGEHHITCLKCGTQYVASPRNDQRRVKPGIVIVDTLEKCWICTPRNGKISYVHVPVEIT